MFSVCPLPFLLSHFLTRGNQNSSTRLMPPHFDKLCPSVLPFPTFTLLPDLCKWVDRNGWWADANCSSLFVDEEPTLLSLLHLTCSLKWSLYYERSHDLMDSGGLRSVCFICFFYPNSVFFCLNLFKFYFNFFLFVWISFSPTGLLFQESIA